MPFSSCNKCLLRHIRVLEENTTRNLDRVAIQRASSFFPKTITAWNGLAFARHAASPKQIATHHESSMATSANQLNLANQVQTPMYSFMLLNIARLFTKSKPKFKLLHDLCSRSTLFLGLCETFLFDGINDCEIQIPDFTVIRCDRFSREGGGVCIYLRNSFLF